MYVESNNDVYVVQRPELTRLTDEDGDDVVDKYQTVCDKWGVVGRLSRIRVRPGPRQEGQLLHHAERRLRRRAPGAALRARLVS